MLVEIGKQGSPLLPAQVDGPGGRQQSPIGEEVTVLSPIPSTPFIL